MKNLLRILRLTAAYPGRFGAYVVLSAMIGGIAAAFVGVVMQGMLGLLARADTDTAATAPAPFHVDRWTGLAADLAILRERLPGGAWTGDGPPSADAVASVTARARAWTAPVQSALDAWTALPMRTAFYWMVAVAMGLFVAKCAVEYARRYLQGWLRGRVVMDAQNRLAGHLLHLDFAFFQNQRQGELVSRLTNDLNLLGSSVRMACTLVDKPLLLLGGVAGMVAIDWRLAAVGLGALPLGAVALSAVARKIRRMSHRAQAKFADLTETMVQFLSGMRIVKAYACEAFEAQAFARDNRLLFDVTVKRTRARAQEKIITEMMTSLAALGVVALGGWWIFEGEISYSKLTAFATGLAFIAAPVREISTLYGDFQETAAGAVRVFALLDEHPTLLPGTRTTLPDDKTVRFEDVHFAYTPGQPVLRGVDLTLPAGRTVALVGRTGCGKSTLADLALRLRDPDRGRVTIGGEPVDAFTFEALRGGIALVNQDAFLFNCSLRDNIAYGTPGADPARIEAAARAAHIHDDILRFPEGYDTVVGDRGARLSGGQRQRIAIARALFKDAPILILDEATSALDAGSERAVQEALAELMRGRTCLVIAHRLSTIRRADAIAWLEDGRVAASGTHGEMLKRSPVYAHFVDLQTR